MGNCSVTEVSTGNPFEGNMHFRIDYNATGFWSGFGLNMDNWGSGQPIDFAEFSALQLSYRGINGPEVLQVQLRDANGLSHALEIGSNTEAYQTVTLPFGLFTAGLEFDLSAVTELTFSTSSADSDYSGTAYLDAILLVNESSPANTSLRTWSRYASIGKGVNFANWLEAAWLIEFETYPEVNKYNRTVVQNLIDMGFNSVRLPICFEIVADENPPYTIPPDHVMFDLIDSTIAWAEEMGFNLIIDNHHGHSLTDANFQSEIQRKRAIWEQIIDRYGNLNPEKYFFELYNEPTNTISNANLHTVMDSILATVRSMVPDHTIIIGGNFWNSIGGLLNTTPYDDPDIIYTFHSYDPFSFTHQGMSWTSPPFMPAVPFPNNPDEIDNLQGVIASGTLYSEVYRVPVMLGEFGCSTAADAQSRCNYIETIGEALDQNAMPWYYWDAISPSDAFGFLDGAGDPIHCFAEALHLGENNVCALLVTSTANSGPGSLRDQLTCALPGDTISFAPDLAGDTIQLISLPLFLNKDIYLNNQTGLSIFLDATSSDELLFISPSSNVYLNNLSLLFRSGTPITGGGELLLQKGEINLIDQDSFNLTEGILEIIERLDIK